ncbi:ABC transporter permease [Chloroflexota bacterium]
MAALFAVFQKELADHFTSWRFIILFVIVLVVSIFAIYIDAQYIRQTVSETQFVFLQLYTTSGQALPLFLFFIAFFMPVVGIALGFDAINSEKSSGTLSRLLSQPIYRDAVVNGKFLAGVTTIAIMLTSIILLVAGLGLRMIGVPPSSEEAIRLLSFLIMSIIYGAFWLGLAILFSIFFRRVATSALAAISLWMLFIALFAFPLFANMGQVGVSVMMVSPITLFWQIVNMLLNPAARLLGQVVETPSPLSLDQSLLLVWPHLVSIIALTVICFAVSYIRFMREEIRST